MGNPLEGLQEYRSVPVAARRKHIYYWKECKAAERQIEILSEPSLVRRRHAEYLLLLTVSAVVLPCQITNTPLVDNYGSTSLNWEERIDSERR